MNATDTTFVGREPELAIFDAVLERVAGGDGRTLVIEGEPGIGKTRLLGELVTRAKDRGMQVLHGRAAEFERDLPYGAFLDAVQDELLSLGARGLDRLGVTRVDELAAMTPELAELGVQPAATLVADERHRSHRAVREVLEALASRDPLLLVLDDLHWADDASIELLSGLVLRPPSGPVLLALSVRSNQVPERLRAALATAGRAGAIASVQLGPLDPDEASRLLGEAVPRPVVDLLFRESGGNPFYLEQLARAPNVTALARGRGGGPPPSLGAPGALGDDQSSVGVPAVVAAALADELSRLGADARALLHGAAVAGETFELDLAAAAAEIDAARALPALDELLASGLLLPTDVPRRFRFRHPIVRRAVYEDARAGWRLAAHARAVTALRALGAPPQLIAHHLEQSAQPGDAAAIASLRAAGDAAAPRAPAAAARWYEAALRLMPRDDDRLESVAVLRDAANALSAAGRLADARERLIEALELTPPDDAEQRVELIVQCAAVEHWLGRHDDAHVRLAGAMESLPDRHSAAAVRLDIELAIDGIYEFALPGRRNPLEAAQRFAADALDTAIELADPVLEGAAAAALAFVLAASGRMHEAAKRRDHAAAVIDALSDDALARTLEALYHLAWAEAYIERFEQALAHTSRGMAIARATGHAGLFLPMTLANSHPLVCLGRLQEAAELLDEAIDAARLSANPQELYWALWERAFIAWTAGDLAAATELIEESVEEAKGRGPNILIPAEPAWTHAMTLADRGDAARAREMLLDAFGGEDLPSVIPAERCLAYLHLTLVELALDRPDRAGKWAERAAEMAEAFGLPLANCWARFAQSGVLLATREFEDALAAASEARALAEEAGALVEAGRARLLAGRALAGLERRDEALAELEAAAAGLGECGAIGPRDEAVRELRRLGRRITRPGPRAREGEGIASLTAREREIAELVRQRKTNREIAAELFLSEKTVETHLRNVFARLGVSSRVEVARAMDSEH